MRKYMHARIIVCFIGFIGVIKKMKIDKYAKSVILLDEKRRKRRMVWMIFLAVIELKGRSLQRWLDISH